MERVSLVPHSSGSDWLCKPQRGVFFFHHGRRASIDSENEIGRQKE